ncbi:histone-lysine N-methyltransferase SETDB1-B-like [Betta splendens]|uniref:Histone-lysine N-methyltransferase SETDB1-B-like n=1 Tax=Betta splendens TaxID=158456 RepID=A0A6P7NTY6_BETSP|nr:histone-lysine N-methyltransferase SETDB1-B-like [Betta splendens]
MIKTENMAEAPYESVYSVDESLDKKPTLDTLCCYSHGITKYAVVVLTRLPEYKISALRPPTPQQFYSEDESLSSSDSDMQWEPQGHSSDSDFFTSAMNQKAAKAATESSVTAPSPPPATSKTNTVPRLETTPVIISSAFAHTSRETTNVRPNLPEEEVKVDMMVLARKKHMKWQRGKITELLTKEDGRLKYKVNFEEKGRSLVSGHHIAFDHTPKLEQLYVGARVVVRCQENKFKFSPGILAELPSRKNRLRFLVFVDDHTPVYVGLPSLHLVCRPLEDNLEDVPDGPHRDFLKQYLKDWPYPHLTQYKPGQTFNAELNGVLQKCEVQVVDSSLIQVVFQANQQKEWIHRGSIRLEHMTRFLELKELGNKKKEKAQPQIQVTI